MLGGYGATRTSAQVVYNMLNPSAGAELPPNYPAQDYGRLLDHTRKAGVGVIGIRVLAGGALSGSTERQRFIRQPDLQANDAGAQRSRVLDLHSERQKLSNAVSGRTDRKICVYVKVCR